MGSKPSLVGVGVFQHFGGFAGMQDGVVPVEPDGAEFAVDFVNASGAGGTPGRHDERGGAAGVAEHDGGGVVHVLLLHVGTNAGADLRDGGLEHGLGGV